MIRPACSTPASCGAGWGWVDAAGVKVWLERQQKYLQSRVRLSYLEQRISLKHSSYGSGCRPVPPASWRDRRTGGEGWGSSAGRPELIFEGSTSQAKYIYVSVPSLSHFSSGLGDINTLLMARRINYARLCYRVSSFPLSSFVTL